jgi:hypothetical protein
MSDLTYIPTPPPSRPFQVGDEVQTLDRNHRVMEVVKVTKVTKRRVYTDCGRRWAIDGSWHDGSWQYPFPSIRLVSDAPKKRSSDEAERG